MLRGIIFDFDGLILDTETPLCQGWSEICASFGLDLPRETWISYIGSRNAFNRYDDLEKRLGRTIDKDEVQRRFRARTATLLEKEEVRRGVWDTVREAERHGLKLGIASNSERSWVAGHLERLDMDGCFGAISCGDEVATPKPAPDVYLEVMENLGLAPEDSLAFEDSAPGVEAAKRAGLFCIAVPNTLTVSMDLAQADLTVGSLADLPFDRLLKHFEERNG